MGSGERRWMRSATAKATQLLSGKKIAIAPEDERDE
jgi:hypothetical protein